jgi:hypothetical protein
LEGGDLHVPIENKWFQLAANPRYRSCSNLFSRHPALLADSHHVGPYFCGMSPPLLSTPHRRKNPDEQIRL